MLFLSFQEMVQDCICVFSHELWIVNVVLVDRVGHLLRNLATFHIPEVLKFTACRLTHFLVDGAWIL